MNVVIIGSAGFLGRELASFFKDAVLINRPDCDLLVRDSVRDIADKYFNSETILINCAGRNWFNNSLDVYADNITMYSNLSEHFNKCCKVFLFSSGAEYGRAVSNAPDINNNPITFNADDYYGMSKAFITKDCRKYDNVYNFRIFGCFGPTEHEKKFIKLNILKYLRKEEMIINSDKEFDYFYVEDIYRILKYIIENNFPYREMNLTYSSKIKWSEILKIINTIDTHRVPLKCTGIDEDYTGKSDIIQKIPIELVGLTNGLKECYLRIKLTENKPDYIKTLLPYILSAKFDFLFKGIINHLFLDGHYYECGVAYGGSARLIALILNDKNSLTHKITELHLFDTFQGLPDPSEFDRNNQGTIYHKKGDIKSDFGASKKHIEQNISNTDFIEYHIGLIPDTFRDLENHKIAFAHIDVDLYQSYMDCLSFIWPRIVPGGMILFDDVGHDNDCPGARKAVEKFCHENNIVLKKKSAFQYYIEK